MTIDYTQFRMKCNPIWGNERIPPSQLTNISYGVADNIIRRMSDIFGLDINNYGIFPSASLVERDGKPSLSYYKSYCTPVAISGGEYDYYDFDVEQISTTAINIGYGLAYDGHSSNDVNSGNRRIVINDTDTWIDLSSTSPVDSYGWPKPASSGCQGITFPSTAGTYDVYIKYLPVVGSSATYSVDEKQFGAVRYTDIEDGYDIIRIKRDSPSVPNPAQLADASYIWLASVTINSSFQITSVDSSTYRTYCRIPGGMVTAHYDTDVSSILTAGPSITGLKISFADHIQSKGTNGGTTYNPLNPHDNILSDFGGYSSIEGTVAGYFNSGFVNGVYNIADITSYALFTPSITGGGALKITGFSAGDGNRLFINGFEFEYDSTGEIIVDGSYPDTTYGFNITMTGKSGELLITANGAPSGTYYVGFEQTLSSDGYKLLVPIITSSPLYFNQEDVFMITSFVLTSGSFSSQTNVATTGIVTSNDICNPAMPYRWSPRTTYVTGDVVFPRNLTTVGGGKNKPIRLECLIGGISSNTTEPDWTQAVGTIFTDGGVTWIVDDIRDGNLPGDIAMKLWIKAGNGYIKADGTSYDLTSSYMVRILKMIEDGYLSYKTVTTTSLGHTSGTDDGMYIKNTTDGKIFVPDLITNQPLIRPFDTTTQAGTYQADALQNITGTLGGILSLNTTHTGPFILGHDYGVSVGEGLEYGTYTTGFDLSQASGVRTATETRPRNIAMLPLIKY